MADPLICWVLDVGFEKYPVVSMTNHGLMPVRKLMQAPPCIHVTIEDLKVQSGEEAKFEAVIEGNPTPEITWYKCGVLLSASDRVYLSQKDAECSLTLLTVSSQDRGIYTCVAKNISGEVSCKAELSVYEGTNLIHGKH
ncbi:UNVERIFIED_CONTAM: hypothetical protein FKN15_072979 [Acipenser sinensis]